MLLSKNLVILYVGHHIQNGFCMDWFLLQSSVSPNFLHATSFTCIMESFIILFLLVLIIFFSLIIILLYLLHLYLCFSVLCQLRSLILNVTPYVYSPSYCSLEVVPHLLYISEFCYSICSSNIMFYSYFSFLFNCLIF